MNYKYYGCDCGADFSVFTGNEVRYCPVCGQYKSFKAYKGEHINMLPSISIKPKVENGKVLLDKSKEDHRYIMEDKY